MSKTHFHWLGLSMEEFYGTLDLRSPIWSVDELIKTESIKTQEENQQREEAPISSRLNLASSRFDPSLYLKTVLKDLSFGELVQYQEDLRVQCDGVDSLRQLVREKFLAFVKAVEGVQSFHREMQASDISRLTQRCSESLNALSKKVTEGTDELRKVKQVEVQLKQRMGLLEALEDILRLPEELKQADRAEAVNSFLKARAHLEEIEAALRVRLEESIWLPKVLPAITALHEILQHERRYDLIEMIGLDYTRESNEFEVYERLSGCVFYDLEVLWKARHAALALLKETPLRDRAQTDVLVYKPGLDEPATSFKELRQVDQIFEEAIEAHRRAAIKEAVDARDAESLKGTQGVGEFIDDSFDLRTISFLEKLGLDYTKQLEKYINLISRQIEEATDPAFLVSSLDALHREFLSPNLRMKVLAEIKK